MSFNATADPWVAYLLQDGTTQSLLMSAALLIRSLWATLFMAFNVALVYVTVANKSLHGICNILIATESFLAIPMDVGFHVSTVIFLSGVKFITFRTCFPIILCFSNVPGNIAQIAMVLTGVDRLLCVAFPIWYKTRQRWQCFCCFGTVQAMYGIFTIIYYIYDYGQSNQMTLVMCSSQDQLLGGGIALMQTISMTLSGMLMATYSLIFFFTFILRPFAKNINDSNRRLIKSLIFIIGMQLFGVFFRLFMNMMFATYWKVDVYFNKTYGFMMNFVTITVYSPNAPVLYVFSEEYRRIFNKHFPWLPTIFSRLNGPHRRIDSRQQQQNVVVVNRKMLVNNFTKANS